MLVCVLHSRKGRVVARVHLQSVLQWISQLHLFKGSAESAGASAQCASVRS